jgi:hypothetical protein
MLTSKVSSPGFALKRQTYATLLVGFSRRNGGRYHDNISIGRLWRRNASCKESLKYELIYLMEFEDGIH